jgi:uncharacterized membrane protein YbhN (UPF0104 family)
VDAVATMRQPGSSAFVTFVRTALLVAPWLFIAYLFRDVGSVSDAFADANLAWLVGAVALMVAVVAGAAILWSRLVVHLLRHASRPRFLPLLQSFARSWLARYIPGKIWSYGARVVQTDSGSVPRRIVASSLLTEFAYTVGTATVVGLGVWIGASVSVALGIVSLTAGLVVLVTIVPRLDALAILLLKWWGRFLPERWRSIGQDIEEAAAGDPGLSFTSGLTFGTGYLLNGLVGGFSFVFVVMSVEDIGWSDVPLLIAGYNLSAVVGILVIFAPAGLGVREAVLAGLITPVVPAPVAATVAILMRVVVVVADLFFVGSVEVAGMASGRRNASSVPAIDDADPDLSAAEDGGDTLIEAS